MRKASFATAASAFAVAMLALGCGGGGTDEVTASSITKAEYIKQASAICEDTAKQMQVDYGVFIQERQDEKAAQGDSQAAELVNTVFAPHVEREIDELRELGAPEGDVETVEAMLRKREEALASVKADPESAFTNKPFEKSINAAKDYGVAACAVP